MKLSEKIVLLAGEDLRILAEHMVDVMQEREFSVKPKPDVKFMNPAKLAKEIGCGKGRIAQAIRSGKYGRVDNGPVRPRLYATVTEAREYHFGKTDASRRITGERKNLYGV
jgi:hypothetical protein